jgi:hypothetical protein
MGKGIKMGGGEFFSPSFLTKSISTPLDRIQFTHHWMEINNNIFDQQWKIPVLHFYEQHAESRLSYVRQKQ